MKNAKMLMIALAAVLALSLVGCSSAPAASASPEVSASAEATPVPTPEITMTAQEIADDLMNIDDLFSSMDHSEQDLFAEMCGLDLSLNDAMMNVKSHTLYIAKVKDAADMDAVKTAFQTRKEQMEQSFERYLEDQYEIAKAGQIVTSGNWVMLVICEDSPKVVDRFNELMGA